MENGFLLEPGTMSEIETTQTEASLHELPDSQLIQQALNRNMQAYEELVQRYYQSAYRIALFYLHNPDLALDISQEAFVRIHRNLKSFDPQKPFGAWLYQIVKNLCLNYIDRYRNRWMVFSDAFPNSPPAFTTDQQSPLQKMLQEEVKQRVWKGLQQLAPREREIIILRDFNDFSYEEIAEALQIPVGTVMSRLFYARKQLAQVLGGSNE